MPDWSNLGDWTNLKLPARMFTPPGTPPAPVITAVTLSLMHIVTYAMSVPLFIRLVLK